MDTSDIVKNIAFGNYEIAKNVINHVLLSKTAIALDEKKKEVAKKMYCEECDMNEEKKESDTPLSDILKKEKEDEDDDVDLDGDLDDHDPEDDTEEQAQRRKDRGH
jgi:hypothetical protein